MTEECRTLSQREMLALSVSKVGIWDWHIETGELYLAPNLKALLGYQDHEMPNRLDDWAKTVHPDDLDRVTEALNAHLNGKAHLYEVTNRMVHKDGTTRWFLTRGIAIRDASGKAVRLIGTDIDITSAFGFMLR